MRALEVAAMYADSEQGSLEVVRSLLAAGAELEWEEKDEFYAGRYRSSGRRLGEYMTPSRQNVRSTKALCSLQQGAAHAPCYAYARLPRARHRR